MTDTARRRAPGGAMSGDVQTKRIRADVREVKAAGEHGLLRAIVAHLEPLVDHQGHIIRRGATESRDVTLAAYNHSGEMHGALPPGKGHIFENGPHVLLDAEFFPTTSGQEHRATLLGLGQLAEFSVEYRVTEEGPLTTLEQRAGAVRAIKRWSILAVAPVLAGAMPDTGIVAIKCSGCGGAEAPAAKRQPPPAEVQQLVRDAKRTIEWSDGLLAALKERQGPLAVDIAAKSVRWLTDGRVQEPPIVKFFDPDGKRSGYYSFTDPGAIYIARGLADEDCVRAVAHETQHLLRPWDAREELPRLAEESVFRRWRQSFEE